MGRAYFSALMTGTAAPVILPDGTEGRRITNLSVVQPAEPVPAKPGVFQVAGTRFCRECGCTDFDACVHAEHGACWWVESDLFLQSLQVRLG